MEEINEMKTGVESLRNEAFSLRYYPIWRVSGHPRKHLSQNSLSSNRDLKVEPPNTKLVDYLLGHGVRYLMLLNIIVVIVKK
jgi:hypothetical protein